MDRPTRPGEAQEVQDLIARQYAAAVVDTDADPWCRLWEHLVESSDALVLVHTGSPRGAQAAEQTLRHLERIDPSARGRAVGISIGGQLDDDLGIEWTHIASPTGPPGVLHWDDLPRSTRGALTHVARQLAAITEQEN